MRFFSYLISLILGSWLSMLAIGVIHHEWLTNMPTVGFRGALIITFLFGLIGIPFVLGSTMADLYQRGGGNNKTIVNVLDPKKRD